jgi:hypothetical protein
MKISNPFTISRNISVEFSGSINEGIALLTQSVGKQSFSPKLDDGLIGKVSEEKIEIWLHRPFSRNILLPVFEGKFIDNGQVRVLVGDFKLHKYVKRAFYLGLIGIALFWTFISIRDQELKISLWACIANYAFMYLWLYLSRPIAMKDVGTIENQIRKILTQDCI